MANKQSEDKNPSDYTEFKKGSLAGRVYNDGRVIIGGTVYDNVNKAKLEVEISTNHDTAREFLEHMVGLIKTAQGCY